LTPLGFFGTENLRWGTMKKLCGGASFIACFCTFLGVYALPTGEYVESGGARFREVGQSRLDITCQDLTVINWDKFSVEAHEHLIFHLKEGDRVLNQVDGHLSGLQMSRILGTLESKGNIFLINPAGILIGKDAVIDVGSLVASTLQMKSSEFLALKDLGAGGAFELSLSGKSASKIVNFGNIHASIGSILLFAPEIEQKGTLSAPEGNIGLYAAYTAFIELKKKAHPIIKAHIDPKSYPRKHRQGITQEGAIEALKVEMQSASHAYALAINQTGHIEAKRLCEEGGKIYLRAESGKISQSGELKAGGGEIALLGPEIALEGGSEIDVSSSLRGGRILLGQDGTHTLSLEKGARLSADGILSAAGGEIKCFTSALFNMEAEVSVQGGFSGGNGGHFLLQMPQSGLFNFDGIIDAKAPRGQEGALALIGPFGTRHFIRGAGHLKFDSSGAFTQPSYSMQVRSLNPFFKPKIMKNLEIKPALKKVVAPKLQLSETKISQRARVVSVDIASGLLNSTELGSSPRSSFTRQRVEGMFSRPKVAKVKTEPKAKGHSTFSHKGKKTKKSQKQKKSKVSKIKKHPGYPGRPT